MRIIDPQSAVLTNIEVLAYLTANPAHRPPNPPPNSHNWVPSPDLRDHNTVVKEIHNYATRLSPHLLKYPRYLPTTHPVLAPELSTSQIPPPQPDSAPTPMDKALRTLISRLKPYGLTKGEVVMILNLGVGLSSGPSGVQSVDGKETDMDNNTAGQEDRPGDEGAAGTDGDDDPGDDYGELALLDTVIEERDERLSNEDVVAILGIIRETLRVAPGVE